MKGYIRKRLITCFKCYSDNKYLSEHLCENINPENLYTMKLITGCLGKGISEVSERLKNMCLVAEKTKEHFRFDEFSNELIREMFEKGRSYISYSVETGYSKSSIYRMQNKVLSVAEKWARQLKVI